MVKKLQNIVIASDDVFEQTTVYRKRLGQPLSPLGLRSVGHGVMGKYFKPYCRETDFFHLIWGMNGWGEAVTSDFHVTVGPQTVALLPPQKKHSLRAVDQSWEYSWCTIDGICANEIVNALQLTGSCFTAGPCPEARFTAMAEKLAEDTLAAELAAGSLLYDFLVTLTTQRQLTARRPSRAETILNALPDLTSPEVNLKTLADTIEMSRYSVIRAFQNEYRMTPKAYIDQIRLQKAAMLLRENRTAIAEIARQCGFADANYFTKFFRRKTGLTPAVFRKQQASL